LDKRVEKILEKMRDDVRGELSLAEFAQSVNLSIWRLSHIFKTDVGMPPIKYLRLLRMERAKGLLESSFLSVKEIAYQVGVNDESHFVRDFKSTYGYSPAIYRSHFRSNGNGHTNDNANGDGAQVDQPQVARQPSQVRRQIARIAKQSILPSLHLFVYLISYFQYSF
jgi:AraC-like DNA-binding protein